MSEFEIDTVAINSAAESVLEMERKFKSIIVGLDDVINELKKYDDEFTKIINFINIEKQNTNRELIMLGILAKCLSECAKLYSNTEKSLTGKKFTKWTDFLNNSASNGDTYGGDQNGPATDWEKNKDLLRSIIKKYDRYKDYTDADIEKLLKKLNSEGCGYTALMNTVVMEYRDRPDEFEKIFGFPLYDKNGKINYSALILDFYAATDNTYFVGDNQFEFKYEDYNTEDGNPFKYDVKNDSHGNGTEQNQRRDRFTHYLKAHGIDVDYETSGAFSMFGKDTDINDCQSRINAGDYPVISVIASDKNPVHFEDAGYGAQDLNGEHVMLVTGTTSDGKIIVSSWGCEYYIDYNDIKDCSYIEYASYKK